MKYMRRLSAFIALVVAALVATAIASGPVSALEFRSIADELSVLYDTPSKDSAKRLILTKDYPVEVIIASGDWVRVRDDKGTFAWSWWRCPVPKRLMRRIRRLARSSKQKKVSFLNWSAFPADGQKCAIAVERSRSSDLELFGAYEYCGSWRGRLGYRPRRRTGEEQ
jgi:SH3-like domain-containing protein